MGKVKYNLKNVHYAPMEEDGSYGEILALPGAVSLSVDPTGEDYDFWADGGKYFSDYNNTGYEGDLSIALITDEFRKVILKEVEDANKVLIEKSDVTTAHFALGFQIDGNQGSTYFWYYDCTASRPSTEANTTEESKNVDTDTLNWKCAPKNGKTRAKSQEDTPSTVLDNWFKTVYVEAEANG